MQEIDEKVKRIGMKKKLGNDRKVDRREMEQKREKKYKIIIYVK